MYRILIFCLMVSSIAGWAQPGTEIYLFDLVVKKDKISITNRVNVTHHKGYDNQPFFHPDRTELYYASADSTGTTNIFKYDYSKKQTTAITSTQEREFSPTITPDKKFISCIIQYADSRQYLIQYPLSGGKPEVLIDNLTVGYHAWANESDVLVFALPQPFTLHAFNVKTHRDTVIADSVGRCLQKIPRENAVSFLQQVGYEWFIRKWDADSRQISTIVKCLPGGERDITWTPDKNIIVGNERKLFHYETKEKDGWKEIQIGGGPLPGNISRIAVNATGNKIALVISE